MMMNSNERLRVDDDSGLVLTTDPKPRLRWTVELHQRFVDAVAQLGGPDKATPKTIMRVMGVKGLTLYHLKSHLQKFRLGKQPHGKEFNIDHSFKDGKKASAFEIRRNTSSSSGILGSSMNNSNGDFTDAIKMQMEVQRRLQEQLEVQRHLQLRIEAQGKYMQNILHKACQSLSEEPNIINNNVQDNNSLFQDHLRGSMKEFVPHAPMNFHCLQNLNIYNNGDQPPDLHQNIDRPSSFENFMKASDENLCGERKRPNPYIENNGKSPITLFEDLHLQELGP